MDGFDVQSMGYVAPAIAQDWRIPAADLGPVFGRVQFGREVGKPTSYVRVFIFICRPSR